jgi:hypothetical protein
MRIGFIGRCERVRQNNGIVEVLITRREDGSSQEEHALFNLEAGPNTVFFEGQSYWVEIRSASLSAVD